MIRSRLTLAVLLIGMLGVAASGFERWSDGPFESGFGSNSGPDVDVASTTYPSLRWAILERDLRQVQRLVSAGANVDQRLFNDETPALMAAKVECCDIVLFLLGEGADPAKPDAFGDTLAMIARTSNLHPSAEEYRDLEAVRDILRREGLY